MTDKLDSERVFKLKKDRPQVELPKFYRQINNRYNYREEVFMLALAKTLSGKCIANEEYAFDHLLTFEFTDEDSACAFSLMSEKLWPDVDNLIKEEIRSEFEKQGIEITEPV